MLQFDWDPAKATSNVRKHGVSFEDATTVFDDPLAVIFDDEEHSGEEVREIIVGHTITQQLLLVAFTERRGVLRIISARRATARERKRDEERTTF